MCSGARFPERMRKVGVMTVFFPGTYLPPPSLSRRKNETFATHSLTKGTISGVVFPITSCFWGVSLQHKQSYGEIADLGEKEKRCKSEAGTRFSNGIDWRCLRSFYPSLFLTSFRALFLNNGFTATSGSVRQHASRRCGVPRFHLEFLFFFFLSVDPE